MFVTRDYSPHAYVVDWDNIAGPAEGRVYHVPAATVDEVVDNVDSVHFIKVDAKDEEADILERMTKTLKTHRPIMIVEFDTKRRYDGRALLEFMGRFYENLSYLGLDGTMKSIDHDTMPRKNIGQEWLLYFGPSVAD